MTSTMAVNSANDIYVGADGNLAILSGLPAIEAACASATKAQLGEMVLAQGQGIPNFGLIWNGSPDYAIWQSYIQNTLLGVNGVQEVSSLSISVTGNTVSYKAKIKTQFGTGNISG